jgi:WXG100 family type VII secretion target
VSAAADLAGYAGGDAVLAEAKKVENANPGAINDAANRLSTAATNVATDSGEVAKAVKGLDDAWQGSSADGFVAYMDRFGKAGTDVGQSMTQAADALKKVAEAIDGAKTFVSNRCENALTEIRNWIAKTRPDNQAAVDDFTRGVCGDLVTEIQSHLKETESALSAAAGVLKGAQTPASTFDSMPDPNTQPSVPHPGQPIDWAPTPPGETKPSGTDNGQPAANTDTGSGSGSGDGSGSGSGSGGGGGGGGHSGGGGGGGGMGSSGGPPAGGPPPGNVQEWIKQAIEILRQNGINVSDADAQAIWQIIQHESGGNPHAINNWDSNAAAGHPSKGLMQCIDSTFNAHKLAGHDDIWNPVDNIIAGVRYSVSRYGSLSNVPGIKAIHGGGGYVGY